MVADGDQFSAADHEVAADGVCIGAVDYANDVTRVGVDDIEAAPTVDDHLISAEYGRHLPGLHRQWRAPEQRVRRHVNPFSAVAYDEKLVSADGGD